MLYFCSFPVDLFKKPLFLISPYFTLILFSYLFVASSSLSSLDKVDFATGWSYLHHFTYIRTYILVFYHFFLQSRFHYWFFNLFLFPRHVILVLSGVVVVVLGHCFMYFIQHDMSSRKCLRCQLYPGITLWVEYGRHYQILLVYKFKICNTSMETPHSK